MDVADPAPDFQHRCTVEVIRTGEVHDAPRRGRQSMTAILTRELAGESSIELPLVCVWRARTAALIHDLSIPRAARSGDGIPPQSKRPRAVTAREQRRRPVSMASRGEMATSFGAAAGTYDQGRPGIRVESFAWMLQRVHHEGRAVRVADAGTGKLTRAAGETRRRGRSDRPRPCNAGAELRMQVHGVPTFVGSAEWMPLPHASVDALLFGQASSCSFAQACPVPDYGARAALPVVAAVMALAGLAAGPLNPLIDSALLHLVPPAIRARVLGAINAGVAAAIPDRKPARWYRCRSLGLVTLLLLAAALYLAVILSADSAADSAR